jgi:hypothetical protein
MSAKVIKLFMDIDDAQKFGCAVHADRCHRFCGGGPERLMAFGYEVEWSPVDSLDGFPKDDWLPNPECDCEKTSAWPSEETDNDMAELYFVLFGSERPFFNVRPRRETRQPGRPCEVIAFGTGRRLP